MELTQDDVIRILKLIDESPMGRVSLQLGELKIEVTKGTDLNPVSATAAAPEKRADAPPVKTSAAPREAGRAGPYQAQAGDENLLAIKAPLLGIVYRQPQPGSPPYVEVGSPVEENTTVALIEVMKLFNPVMAGVRGRIHRVCVENSDLVEYGQLLFLVEPE